MKLMKRIIRYIFLFIAWLLAGLAALLVVAALLIQLQPVKNKLSGIAEKQAEKVLNGKLSIGKISGNFFTNISLENVLWTNNQDTVAYLNSVSASYSLWPLTRGELQIENAAIHSPYIHLQQKPDSTWNFASLMKRQPESSVDTTSGSGDFQLVLSEFNLTNGRVKIQALDSIIPDEVKNWNMQASGAYSSNEQSLTLKQFGFKTQRPGFNLQELSFSALHNEKNIALNNFRLKTAQNALNAEASYSDDSDTEISAEMKTEPLYIGEFNFLLPTLNLPAHPVINFKTNTNKEGINATLLVKDKSQEINLELSSANLIQFVENSAQTNLQYNVSGNVNNINLAHWLGNPQLDHTINGTFEIDGEGTDPKTAAVNLKAKFNDCVFAQKPVEKINVDIELQQGNVKGIIDAEGNFGVVSVAPEIENLLENPIYNLQAQIQGLNLAPLLTNDSLQSDINLRAQLHGKGFDPQTLEARAEITASKSVFSNYTLDSLFGQVIYENKNVVIDSLWATAKTLTLKAGGNYNLAGNSDLQFSAQVDDIRAFSAYIPLDSIRGSGSINAHLSGETDSLLLEAQVELQNAGFTDITAKRIVLDGTGQLAPNDTSLLVNAIVEQFNAGGFELDSVVANAGYFIDSIQLETRASGNEMHTELQSEILLNDGLTISLSEWSLNFKNQNLTLENAPAVIEIDSLEYRLSNLKMASDRSDSAQYIKAGGVISQYGNEDFQFEIANVNIAGLLESFGIEAAVSGNINASANIGGTAVSPDLNGNISIDDALVYGYKFSDFGGQFSLENNRLNFDAQIVPLDTGLLEINANIPFEARFDIMAFNVNPEDTIGARLAVEQFPLSAMEFLKQAEKVEGVLNGNVEVGGTLKEPQPRGELNLNNAQILIPEYGIEYEDIVLDLHFSENAAQLDSFYIKTDDGNLKASGTVDFGSAFYNGAISNSEVSIHFNSFNPVDHRQFNMELSGDASLKGEAGKVVFDGDLEIPEANIYLPAIMSMAGRFAEPELPQPILVQELNKLNKVSDSTATISDTISTRDTLDLSYLSGLTGKLTVNFPQNTWIKNNDMFVEISGELEVIKNSEFFELFGNINVVRGQYEILGKTFKIQEGTVNFQGGEDLIPRLNIQAIYAFRNPEKAEQKLTVQIQGTATEPEINFTIDGSRISEGDALSYILFGVEMNELTIEQQENVSGAGEIAGSAAMSLLSSQLTDLLGNKLDVDYIELKGDGGFDNATVVVGKYITNDLFVSYEQRFGEPDEKDISKYQVKMEYELFKFLFLQLNNSSTDSGFDVIIKLDSK